MSFMKKRRWDSVVCRRARSSKPQCGAQIDPDGKLYVVLVCEDKIFPYRTPIAEYDMEMSDWCTNDKAVDAEDYQRTVFMTEEVARAALGKEREDG